MLVQLDYASRNGHIHVHVLEWWKSSHLPMKFSHRAIVFAYGNNHIAVLNRWKETALHTLQWLKRTIDLFNKASEKGDIIKLEWLKESGLYLAWTRHPINHASRHGNVAVLEWKTSGLELKYSADVMNDASMNGHIAVLDWWKLSGLELKYDSDAMPMQAEWVMSKFWNGGNNVD
ncbi:hypothetical protein BJ742DRAFT_815303 [Cladochytrium replicatum]|nr:hypothetical protein BJ742DRAFT_815303 [Cladochytrium replicatum]